MSVPQLTVYQNGPLSVVGDQLNTFLQTAQTAAQLRMLSGVSGMAIMLQGIATASDGLGGIFAWNADATAPDDNLNTLVPFGSVPGAWLRVTTLPPPPPPTTGMFQSGTVTLTSTVAAPCAQLTVPPGVWIITGGVLFTPTSGTTTIAFLSAGISASPATNTTSQFLAASFVTGSTNNLSAGMTVISIGVATTLAIEAAATFGVSGMNATGFVQAVGNL